jgi:hypothetical protein
VGEPYDLNWWLNTVLGSIFGIILLVALWAIWLFIERLIENRRYYRSHRYHRRERIKNVRAYYKKYPHKYQDPYN